MLRAVAAARCAGLAANVPTSPGLRRLALGYTLSPAARAPPMQLVVHRLQSVHTLVRERCRQRM